MRTADERRLERCLDILAWCAAARRITAVACAAQAREERAFEAKDRAQKARSSASLHAIVSNSRNDLTFDAPRRLSNHYARRNT